MGERQPAPLEVQLQSSAQRELEIPREACRFQAEPTWQFADGGDKPQAARFAMVATTGKDLSNPWFGKLAIDLQGVRFKQKLPALLDHDTNQRIGYTQSVELTERGIEATGRLINTPHARIVQEDAAAGFPWQASVMLEASKVQVLGDGDETEVNGRTFTGPGAIFRQSTMREVTFTALGADDDTTAAAFSRHGAGGTVAATLIRPEGAEHMTEKNEATPEPREPKAAAPASHSVARTHQARDEGVMAERARVLAILNSTCWEQMDLALQLINEGVEHADALLSLNQDLHARLQSAQQSQLPSPVLGQLSKFARLRPLAADNRDEQTETSVEDAAKAKLKALPEGPEKWKQEFAQSAELQAEFGEERYYLAYKQNEDRIVHFGGTNTERGNG